MPNTVQEARKARKQGTRSEFTKSSKVFARLQDQQVNLLPLSPHDVVASGHEGQLLACMAASCLHCLLSQRLLRRCVCSSSRLRHCTAARLPHVLVINAPAFRVQPAKHILSVKLAQVADAAAKAGGGRFAAAPPTDAIPAERFKL
jgi:hypothetical protein